MNIKLLAISFATVISFLINYFTELTIANYAQYMIVVTLIFTDGLFGIISGVKREGFKTYKALKILKTLVAWIIALSALLVIEKGLPQMDWLSETILIPWVVFEVISILKNMVMCGYIKKPVLVSILNKVDVHKNIPFGDGEEE